MSFCDISFAGTLRGDIRTELDALTRNADTYLSLWREYNELEQKGILRRVQEFSWITYSSQEMLANGDCRFYLQAQGNLEQQLQSLRDLSEFSLEASDKEPDLTSLESATRSQKAFFGQIIDIDPLNYTLDIRPPDPDELLSPPPTGFLFVSLQGDRTRLGRRKRAEELIRTATCPMPQLGLILQNQKVPISNRRKHKPLSRATLDVFNGSPTTRQEEALRVAINTPDIALIQGPPGTGKTKVITALQVRLAEIAEDANVSLSHRLLLTSYQHDAVENAAERTVVFGLPAVRIGGKANRSDVPDNVDRWRRDRIETLRGKLSQFPELPETVLLRQVQNLVTGYVLTPGNLQQTARLLEEIYNLTMGRISGELSDRLLEQSRILALGKPVTNLVDSEARESALRAVRSLRTEPISFSDDGPTTAYKALRRLEPLNLLSNSDRSLLETADNWDNSESPDTDPPFLHDLASLQSRLLDQLAPAASVPVTTPVADPDIEALLEQVREALNEQVRQSQSGVEAVLEEYLNDLKSDPGGVREMLRDYTVVLAATCQQAVGKQMELITGNVDSVFETVIIDEAARANPLDLFIPMSKAERRIILVGDHRQLPHILEEDVERQLSLSSEATQDALRKSLFERLFKQLQEWEKIDGIKRTVTLDTQYRMHPVLGEFVSRTFYEYHGEPPIKAARPEKDFFHNLPGYQDKVAAWIDVPFNLGGETKGQSKSRRVEAKRIADELKRLIQYDSHLTFGVIAFYRAQVTELWQALCEVELAEVSDDGTYQIAPAWRETTNYEGKLVERLRVGTVDAFQGKEFDVVFLSVTRSNNIKAESPETYLRKYGFLLLENRLCVAMSRQQRLLIAAGDLEMVRAEADKPKSERQAIREFIGFYELCKTPQGKVF
jgi:superfamily I DNA/RNA helicase